MAAIYVIQVHDIVLHASDIQPCIYVSHGIRQCAIDQSARFKIAFTWTYTSGGTTYRSSSVVDLSSMTFHQSINTMTDDVHTALATNGPCDTGTNVTVTARLEYVDAGGATIHVSDVESKTVVA